MKPSFTLFHLTKNWVQGTKKHIKLILILYLTQYIQIFIILIYKQYKKY